MSNILHISASIQGENSISRSLSTKLAQGLAAKSGANIIERDLFKSIMPKFAPWKAGDQAILFGPKQAA